MAAFLNSSPQQSVRAKSADLPCHDAQQPPDERAQRDRGTRRLFDGSRLAWSFSFRTIDHPGGLLRESWRGGIAMEPGGQGQLPSGQTAKVRPDYRVQSLH
jgi:hypothetical protein